MRRSIVALAMLIGFLVLPSLVVDVQTARAQDFIPPLVNSYAYLVQLPSGDVELHQINPYYPEVDFFPIKLVTPVGNQLVQANTSPDGQWMTVWFTGEGHFRLYLYSLLNLSGYMVRQVASYQRQFDSDLAVHWSPDSQYFAFNVYDESVKTVYLFSIVRPFARPIRVGIPSPALPRLTPIDLSWSSDSTRLAIVEENCYNLLCTNDIHVLIVDTDEETASVKIDGLICDLNWSPDNTRISFVRDCDYTSIFYRSDVFIWDMPHDSVIQLTHLSNDPATDFATWQMYATGRDTIWYDNDTLLVGAASATLSPPEVLFAETALYRPASGRVAQLADDVAFAWIRNHNTNEFAYSAASLEGVDNLWFDIQKPVIRIATFDGSRLTVLAETVQPASPVWLVAWSPDGQFIAYSTNDGYLFLDKATGKSTEYVPDSPNYVTLGWIQYLRR